MKQKLFFLLYCALLSACNQETNKKYDFVYENGIYKKYHSVIVKGDTTYYEYFDVDSAFNIQNIQPERMDIEISNSGIIVTGIPFNIRGDACYTFIYNTKSEVKICRTNGPFDYFQGTITVKDAYIFEVYFSDLNIADIYNNRYYYDSKRKLIVKVEALNGAHDRIVAKDSLVNETGI